MHITFSSVSNIFGKNRIKGQKNNASNGNANNKWNSSPSISRRQIGPSGLPNDNEGNFHNGFSSGSRKSPGTYNYITIVSYKNNTA